MSEVIVVGNETKNTNNRRRSYSSGASIADLQSSLKSK